MTKPTPQIDSRNGKTSHCSLAEATTLKTLRLISLLFRPIRLRGFYHLCRAVLFITRTNPLCQVRRDTDITLQIDLRDPYWNRLIAPYFHYESEMSHILSHLKTTPYSFIDCGANMGYWSVLTSSDHFGNHPAIAVEPLFETFARLSQNCTDNGQRFSLFNKAISDQSNQQLTLHKPGGHASVSLIAEPQNHHEHTQQITTITIDDMVAQSPKIQPPFVLKLDVEGVEIAALKGATNTLKNDTLIIYEDHAKDASSAVSDYVLNTLKLRVFFVTPQGAIQEITSLTAIKTIKTDITAGYNFFATTNDSPFLNLFTRPPSS